jgi:hypothetical protein
VNVSEFKQQQEGRQGSFEQLPRELLPLAAMN